MDIGVDVKSKDNQGRTCLHLAVEKYHPQVVHFLLLTNDAKTNPWCPSHVRAPYHDDMTTAAWNGGRNKLMPFGADVNAQDKYGWTALHWASEWGHGDVAALLRKYAKTRDLGNREA